MEFKLNMYYIINRVRDNLPPVYILTKCVDNKKLLCIFDSDLFNDLSVVIWTNKILDVNEKCVVCSEEHISLKDSYIKEFNNLEDAKSHLIALMI